MNRAELAREILGHLRSQKAAGVTYVSLGPRPEAVPEAAHPATAPPARAPEPVTNPDPEQQALIPQAAPASAPTLAPMAKRRDPGPEPPPLPFDPDAEMSLDQLEAAVDGCLRCKLGPGRTNLVFGVGNPAANLAIVGEAPGANEDAEGIPFVGTGGTDADRR